MRDSTPAVIVRAIIVKEGFNPSFPVTRTYIFLHKVFTQKSPGGKWPVDDINGQVLDFDMDSRIVDNPLYSDQVRESFNEIPTISLNAGIASLFSPASGIYVNALNHGIQWEKNCSVELIYPDSTGGFMVNAGLRIRGGWSRHPENPKHAFRLFFREEYGNAKLQYPLFGNEGVNEFDKIDLRTAQNYAWSYDRNNGDRNTFVRDVFSRDTQKDMGQPYTRSRYYHLFLNGMYWGLFQTQERAEARFAESYLGGNSDDYDVVKVNIDDFQYEIEATDGNLDAWQEVWRKCIRGFASNQNYFELEGKNANGNPIKNSKVLVDIDNLIDYTLINFYTGNFDSPVSSFIQNKRPNNVYAIYSRKNLGKGFTFYSHDAEHSMMVEPIHASAGLYDNQVNIGNLTGDNKMEVNEFKYFHPAWLHYKLTSNMEYRTRFADHVYKHFFRDGALTPSQVLERWQSRVQEIDTSIVAESARWGDGAISSPRTKNTWLNEINNVIYNYIPFRTNIVIDQLVQANLYPNIMPPEVHSDGVLHTSIIYFENPIQLELINPNTNGEIYYTLDGTDPRNIGGSIYDQAISGGVINLNLNSTTLLKARIKQNSNWSALLQMDFLTIHEDYSNLKITELHYHPKDYFIEGDSVSGKDMEFIEFKNCGENAINLSGLVLDSAVTYEFPENTILPPNNFYVVASKPSDFYSLYGKYPSGNYKKNLSNSGELFLLMDDLGNELIKFTYSDKTPWPENPDGKGPSLVSTVFNPTGDPDQSVYWRESVLPGGTPFNDDTISVMNINTDQRLVKKQQFRVYPNPVKTHLNIKSIKTDKVEKINLEVYDMYGKFIYSSTFSNNHYLDFQELNLPYGGYIVKLQGKQHHSVHKIIYLGR